MALESEQIHPITAGILQGIRREADARRIFLSALGDGFAPRLGEFLLPLRRKLMAQLRRHHQLHGDVQFLETFLDVARRSQLRIVFAAVGDNRHIESVLGVIDGVINAQTGFLWRRQLGRQILEIAVRGGEAGAGAEGAPLIGRVQAQVPGAGAAHREAAQHAALGVGQMAAFLQALQREEVFHRFDHIAFTRPAIGVIASAIHVEADVILIFGSGFVAIELVQKTHLSQAIIPTVQHDFQPPFLDFLAVVGRQRDGVGLNGAVNVRAIAVDDGGAGSLIPRPVTLTQMAATDQAALQRLDGPFAGFLLIELVVACDPRRRLVINFDVGQERIVNFFAAEQPQRGIEFVLAFLDLFEDVFAWFAGGRRRVLSRRDPQRHPIQRENHRHPYRRDVSGYVHPSPSLSEKKSARIT